jgi:hypothetical protein
VRNSLIYTGNRLAIFIVTIGLLFFSNCAEIKPSISKLNPREARIGDEVSIIGRNFAQGSTLLINGQPLSEKNIDISVVSGNEIKFKITREPSRGPYFASGFVQLKIQVRTPDNRVSNDEIFKLINPNWKNSTNN